MARVPPVPITLAAEGTAGSGAFRGVPDCPGGRVAGSPFFVVPL